MNLAQRLRTPLLLAGSAIGSQVAGCSEAPPPPSASSSAAAQSTSGSTIGSSAAAGSSSTAASSMAIGGGTSDATVSSASTSGSSSRATSVTPSSSSSSGASSAALDQAAIFSIMKKAETYQVGMGPSDPTWTNKWTEGTFYVGVLEAYKATQEPKYLTDATRWAAGNRYAITVSATAPDYNSWCPGQVYADLYLLAPATNTADITSSQASFAAVDTVPPPSFARTWWWADALFMAPGLVARLGSVASGTTASAFLDTEWMATQNALYDPSRKLFWRDSTFVRSNTYWSRGNGWVMAGAVRVLEVLPPTDPLYGTLTTLLTNMTGALAPLQGADGLWRSNLMDPAAFPNPETSGTALMTYAMAWGITHGVLDRATMLPVVVNAWNGLVANVSASGMLGYVQPTGSAPAAATSSDTNDYGVGAFLLAGSQVAGLQ